MGKTTLLVKLLLKRFLDVFDKIWIICPTYGHDKAWGCLDKYVDSGKITVYGKVDEHQLKKIWGFCQAQKEIDPSLQFLIYFDDCGGVKGFKVDKPDGVLNQIFCKGNHANISIIAAIQKITLASTIMRINADMFMTFATQQKTEKDYIYNEFGFGDKKSFLKALDKHTSQKYHTFYVNRCGAGAPDYYHNFKLIHI